MSLFDLLFGKNYENDTIDKKTLYDLQLVADRAEELRNECAYIAYWFLMIPASAFVVFFIGLCVNKFHIKTLIFSIFLLAVFLMMGHDFKHKKSAVELRCEAAKKEHDDLEKKEQSWRYHAL